MIPFNNKREISWQRVYCRKKKKPALAEIIFPISDGMNHYFILFFTGVDATMPRYEKEIKSNVIVSGQARDNPQLSENVEHCGAEEKITRPDQIEITATQHSIQTYSIGYEPNSINYLRFTFALMQRDLSYSFASHCY